MAESLGAASDDELRSFKEPVKSNPVKKNIYKGNVSGIPTGNGGKTNENAGGKSVEALSRG